MSKIFTEFPYLFLSKIQRAIHVHSDLSTGQKFQFTDQSLQELWRVKLLNFKIFFSFCIQTYDGVDVFKVKQMDLYFKELIQ